MIILPPGTRIGLFARVSTDKQVLNDSLTVHLERGKEYTELNQWDLVEVYKLDGISGAAILDHPETKRMMRDVETGHIQGLLFSAVARIGRDLLELLQIEKHLRTHGRYLISTRRGVIDTSTPEGMESFVNEGSRGQSERMELSIRIRAGKKTRAKMGWITASQVPYGYRKVAAGANRAKKLEIDPIEGPIRVLMYDLYLKSQKMMHVAAELNARGYLTRNGKPFNHEIVRDTLKDTTAMGIYYANKRGKGSLVKPESEWIAIEVPALIDKEKWDKCQRLIQANYKKPRRTVHPYSGLLICHCGKPMYVISATDHKTKAERFPPYYQCRECKNRINVEVLDQSIAQVFTAFLIQGLPDDARLELSKAEQRLIGLRKEQKQIRQSKKRWAEAYQAGALDLDGFKGYHAPLVERDTRLTAEIARIEAEQRTEAEQLKAQESASQLIQSITWSELNSQEKHDLLREFVENITLSITEIKIQLLYVPKALQLSEPGLAKLHTLSIQRPDRFDLTSDTTNWAHHIQIKRLEKGHSYREAAKIIGVDCGVLMPSGSRPASPSAIPKIIDYLGYIPWSKTPYAQPTLRDAYKAAREICGINQKQMAARLGISQAAYSRLERGERFNYDLRDLLEEELGIEVERVFQAYHQKTKAR